MDKATAFKALGLTSKEGALTAEQITAVKALGCLKDKRFDDIFNVRVITGNGKITSDRQKIVAEAAEKFGSGEITMTTRLTLEIQGVPYDNIPYLILFFKGTRS